MADITLTEDAYRLLQHIGDMSRRGDADLNQYSGVATDELMAAGLVSEVDDRPTRPGFYRLEITPAGESELAKRAPRDDEGDDEADA